MGGGQNAVITSGGDLKAKFVIHAVGPVWFGGVRGLVIGRFEKDSNMTDDVLRRLVSGKPELAALPVVANVDFGHTDPMITFPVGGEVELHVARGGSGIRITRH